MTCPFTGAVGLGIRNIGGGITVYPQMQLVACNQFVMHVGRVFESGILRCIASNAIELCVVSSSVCRRRQLVNISFSDMHGDSGLIVSLSPFSGFKGRLLMHNLRLAQRRVRRWLARRRTLAIAMAFHCRLGANALIRMIPVELLRDNISVL